MVETLPGDLYSLSWPFLGTSTIVDHLLGTSSECDGGTGPVHHFPLLVLWCLCVGGCSLVPNPAPAHQLHVMDGCDLDPLPSQH